MYTTARRVRCIGLTSSDLLTCLRQNCGDLVDDLALQCRWQHRPKVLRIDRHRVRAAQPARSDRVAPRRSASFDSPSISVARLPRQEPKGWHYSDIRPRTKAG